MGPQTAFVFPGQGSQSVGMGQELAAEFSLAKQIFAAADDALGFKISELCFEGPESELMLTANAQPAILTVSIAAMRVYEKEFGAIPSVVLGHSLGEYSALVCAAALSFQDAVRLVHQRGKFMQEATPAGTGAMAAIVGLDEPTLDALCQEAAQGQVLAPANLNGGGQTVVAGHKEAVERVMELAKQKGARLVKALQVSAPFHCALMEPAARRLAEVLSQVEVRSPRVPVVHNVDGRENRDVERIKDLLIRQVTAPVRFEACALRMADLGCTRALEFGPGQVLKGLLRRIVSGVEVRSVAQTKDIAPWS